MSGVARYHAETASPHPQGAFVLYEDYAALLERIAALEADAARYRWLIENSVPQQDDDGRWYWDLSLYAEGPVKAEVDRVIDAALDAARVGG